ncbi:hypothetical protein [Acidocella sp.]|uniref:hypothetical protein n=1 Tax=Acidocella sp. TaxID=50710 RepID=UPI0017958FEE|nr:hypothetical protein [Acidocella sp.]NNM56719.1 hypothetical protein [Acidocella sp.]
MASNTTHQHDAPAEQEFDAASKKGWEHFTKFLTFNTIAVAVVLLLIGAMTVWR